MAERRGHEGGKQKESTHSVRERVVIKNQMSHVWQERHDTGQSLCHPLRDHVVAQVQFAILEELEQCQGSTIKFSTEMVKKDLQMIRCWKICFLFEFFDQIGVNFIKDVEFPCHISEHKSRHINIVDIMRIRLQNVHVEPMQ